MTSFPKVPPYLSVIKIPSSAAKTTKPNQNVIYTHRNMKAMKNLRLFRALRAGVPCSKFFSLQKQTASVSGCRIHRRESARVVTGLGFKKKNPRQHKKETVDQKQGDKKHF